jgi:hypothetical protein
MKFYRFTALMLLLASLSGCVYLDIAAQDTAIPIYPEKVSGAIYFSSGINLNDTYIDIDDPEENEDITTAVMANYKVGFGINEKTDLIVNVGQTNGHGNRYGGYKYESEQYEAGIKYLLKQDGNSYWSVLPSMYLVRGKYRDADPNNLRDDVYTVTGLEGHFLYSYLFGEHLCTSLIGRGSVNRIQRTRFGNDLDTQTTFHYGARANLRLSVWNLYQTTEFGFEVIPVVNGNTQVVSNLSAGLGLKF